MSWGVLRRLWPGRDRAARSEERLSLALSASGMAIWEMDAETGAMWWSEAVGRLLGGNGERPSAATRLAHFVQRLHPEDRPAFQAAVAQALAIPGEMHRVQVRVIWADGSVHWIEGRGQCWEDEKGRRRGLRGSLVDITDVKRAEEELRRSLEEQRVIATVAEAAASAADEDSLFARVTELLRETLEPDNCGFLLLEDERAPLTHVRSFHTRRPPDALRPIPFGTGIVGTVAASGAPRLVEDTSREPDYIALDPDVQSEICAPLKVGPRVLGVLDAESVRVAAFTEADLRLLAVLATHVAVAVERLRSEQALREGAELYRAYFTSSPIALFVSDGRGSYLEVNGAACTLTGFSREELLQLTIADLLAGESPGETGDRLVGLLALGSGRSEIQIRRRDGSLRHCLVHASAIGPDRLLGLLLDITDRREAEERLRESEERFRSLSEAAFEAILVHDGTHIVDVNHALCELGGYAWHELVGREVFDLIAPEHREVVYRNLLAEHDRPYEIEVVRRDGSRLPVEVQARSFPYRGRINRVVAVRDVSERKKAERIRESLIRELESKNAELERFGYTVTHDLKAPLVTIRGFADYLVRDVRQGRADRLAPDAERITEAVGKLQRLLDELFELSRAGRPVGPPSEVRGEEIVQEALRLLRERLTATKGRVEVAGPLPTVFGDRARLVQAFEALLDNALKFSGGKEPPRVVVDSRPGEEGMAVLAVRDNGIGIEPRHRERVFGLLEKLDPHAEGTGIGLAVVKRIVDSHGGRVWLESEGKGAGTTACVSLPLGPSATREPGARVEAERQRG